MAEVDEYRDHHHLPALLKEDDLLYIPAGRAVLFPIRIGSGIPPMEARLAYGEARPREAYGAGKTEAAALLHVRAAVVHRRAQPHSPCR